MDPKLNPDFLEEREYKELSQKFGKKMLSFILEQQKEDLKEFRVSFASYFKKSALHSQGKLPEVQKDLEEAGATYQNGDSIFFLSTKYGDDKDRVLVRSDGRPTYFLGDIAYHKTKIDRGFSHIYNIWGPDHHGYIPRLKGALQALGYTGVFQVFLAQQVNLQENGKAIQMSKRSGKLVSLADLMSKVPVDVLRYFFVMRSFDSPMDFDLDAAVDESEKNPYYYVAYAHARICSIFRKAKEKNILMLSDSEFKEALGEMEWTPSRRKLLLYTVQFPEEAQAASESLEPQRIVQYLANLASHFSRFYKAHENQVIQQELQTARTLLTLLDLVAFCLKKGLNLLGTTAPQSLSQKDKESGKDL